MNNFMEVAFNEAKKAIKHGDVPVGCVIVKNNKIIAKAHNKKEVKKNALYHSEILAINKATKKVKNFRLENCDMYVTLEPCLMCVGAILSARINKVYVGTLDPRFGAGEMLKNNNFNHKCEMQKLDNCECCGEIISQFFKDLRKK